MTASLPTRGKEAAWTPARAPWTVRVSVDAIDARKSKLGRLSPRLLKMMLILDGHCRTQAYSWVSNETLAAEYGTGERSVREMLVELEALGLVERVITDGPPPGFTVRAGIIMRERIDPAQPKADTEAALRTARAALKEGREARRAGKKRAAVQGEDLLPLNKDVVVVKRTHPENDAPAEPDQAEVQERQRPDFDSSPSAVASADQVEADVAPPICQESAQEPPEVPSPPEAPPEGSSMATRHIGAVLRERFPSTLRASIPPSTATSELTDGQKVWFEGLTSEQRDAFAALPVKAQARLLEWHRNGPNPDKVIAAETARDLKPQAAPTPPRPLPESTAELLEQLPGAPPDWTYQAARALVLDFGERKDQELWREFQRITLAVQAGGLPAEIVVNAYRQAMATGIEKPGAKFWAALKALALRVGIHL